MTIITDRVVDYCAQECSWQISGELSVAWMIRGWRYAHRRSKRLPRVDDVLMLGRIVEPRANPTADFRKVNVRVGFDVKRDFEFVPASMRALVESLDLLHLLSEDDAVEWFREYEEIHPFADGNGRTGSLLYNWLRGSLHEPVHPPNLWADPRRCYEGYPVPSV